MPESRNTELTAPLSHLKLVSLYQHNHRRNLVPEQPFCPWHRCFPKRALSLEFVQEQNGFLGIKDLIHIKSKVYSWEELLSSAFFPSLLSVIYFWYVRKPWGEINVICLKLRLAPVKYSLYSPNLKINKTPWVLIEMSLSALNNFCKVYSVIFIVSLSLKFTS